MKKILFSLSFILLAGTALADVDRGKIVNEVIDQFDLKEVNAPYFERCEKDIEFCLFNFSIISTFQGLNLGMPMRLYPDVPPEHSYYESINLATMLGIVNGNPGEPETPFKPDAPATRAEALRIALGATNLVESRYLFELEMEMGSKEAVYAQTTPFIDVPASASQWWQPRYVNFAVERGLIEQDANFRPNEYITAEEWALLVERIKIYLENEKTKL